MIVIARLNLRGSGRWRRARCPLPQCDGKRSLSIAVDMDEGTWRCWRCDAFGTDGQHATGPARPPTPQRDPTALIQHILDDCRPLHSGDPGHRYLTSRGAREPFGPDLRHHAGLWHTPSRREWPAIVAVVRGGDGAVKAIHRTYLTPEGGKAPVEPVRMMLGPTGGGAVRLPGGHVVDLIAVTEGIEDGLRIRDQLGCETWAGLSASGITNIEVPRRVRRVILVPDCDGVGWAATGALERRLVANGVQVQRRWAR